MVDRNFVRIMVAGAHQRLMRFEGSTNVRIDDDDLVTARIDYPAAAEQSSPDPALWEALRDEPLVACTLGAP